MEKSEGNFFRNYKDMHEKNLVFKENLKQHLSNEYLYMSEKKDELENRLLQLKIEQKQRDKILFPNIDQKENRKYFTPLNIFDNQADRQDEKDQQILISMNEINDEIDQLSARISEIKVFLRDMDEIIPVEEVEENNHTTVSQDLDDPSFDDILDEDHLDQDPLDEDPLYEDQDPAFQVDQEFDDNPQNVSNQTTFVDNYRNNTTFYPQMIRNMYDMIDYLRDKYKEIEILLDFDDKSFETDPLINQTIIIQILNNIYYNIQYYDIITVIVQGEVNAEDIKVSVNFICESDLVQSMSVNYDMGYMISEVK